MKTIELSKPVAGHRGQIKQMRFREPNYMDWSALGEVESPIYHEGSATIQQHPAIIAQYAERCLVDEDISLLNLLGLRDTFAVRDAVLSFFREASEPASSPTSPTSLSSSFVGTPAQSES
ncbi:MAG: hypothetical protein JWM36_3218 [Hyphomicrobiales bacterium]|nr:hypothetical protein [Hyphomicrobiales bacterium]